MDLPGAGFLYAMATVSITFVGFSALLIVFRQTMGGGVTKYDTYFTLSFIQIGFIVAGGSLLPPMVALYGWGDATSWRVASGLVVVPLLWFVLTVPKRRRAATGAPVPTVIMTLLTLQFAAAVALALVSLGVFAGHEAAVFGTAMTTILFTSFIAYLFALSVMLPQVAKHDTH